MNQRVDTPRPANKHPSRVFIGRLMGSIVDPSLEYTDPTPDIHALFVQFNDRFFEGRLCAVEVKWSSKLTRCAGLCKYEGNNGLCSIRLSEPLLKLRPRKDLVETLLHEMIHAYMMVYKGARPTIREPNHGPKFHEHMHRINRVAGTSITVYHRFHEEVQSQMQHWYQCNGPCRQRLPCFGTKHHKHCPPWPKDENWQQHKQLCGGTFRKVHCPERCAKGSNKGKAVAVTSAGHQQTGD